MSLRRSDRQKDCQTASPSPSTLKRLLRPFNLSRGLDLENHEGNVYFILFCLHSRAMNFIYYGISSVTSDESS